MRIVSATHLVRELEAARVTAVDHPAKALLKFAVQSQGSDPLVADYPMSCRQRMRRGATAGHSRVRRRRSTFPKVAASVTDLEP